MRARKTTADRSTRVDSTSLRISGRALASALPESCPRCFWIELHCKLPYQIRMPGIFNSIDSYTKKVVHKYYDENHKLPSWYPTIGQVIDYVGDTRALHHTKFQIFDSSTNATLTGSPDDVLKLGDKSYHIVDYKTARLTEAQDELFSEYEVQLNSYAYIANHVGFSPISGLTLIYMEPDTDSLVLSDVKTSLGFTAKSKSVKLQPEKIIPPLLKAARNIFDKNTPPEKTLGCEDCEKLEALVRTVM